MTYGNGMILNDSSLVKLQKSYITSGGIYYMCDEDKKVKNFEDGLRNIDRNWHQCKYKNPQKQARYRVVCIRKDNQEMVTGNLEYNPQRGWDLNEVSKVLAWQGNADDDILEFMKDQR